MNSQRAERTKKNIRKSTKDESAPPKALSVEEQMKQEELKKIQLENEALQVEIDQAKLDFNKSQREENEITQRRTDLYVFDEQVNRASVRKFESWLDKFAKTHPGKPFTVRICSGGGYVKSGLRLYDHLVHLRDKLGHEITIVVLGHACSMASILFQAASPGKRLMGANAYLMIHEMSSGDYGKTTDRKESLAQDVKLEKKLLAILAIRSRLSLAQITRRWKKKDLWFDAEMAIADGFADGIL